MHPKGVDRTLERAVNRGDLVKQPHPYLPQLGRRGILDSAKFAGYPWERENVWRSRLTDGGA